MRPHLQLLALGLLGCGSAPASPEPAAPVSPSSTGDVAVAESAITEPIAPSMVRLDPERCEFTGLPARVGNVLIVGAHGVDIDVVRTVPLMRESTSSAESGELPSLPDDDTIEACCGGDVDSCEAAGFEVDETLASLETRIEPTGAEPMGASGLPRVLEPHEDPAFVHCRCRDGSIQASPNACGQFPACFATFGSFDHAGSSYRILFEKYGGRASYAPPQLEVRRDAQWDGLPHFASPTSGEGCDRAWPEGFAGAWVSWDLSVVVMKVSLSVSMTSFCVPGDEYLLFSLAGSSS